jgi:AbiV family abortive infection protein
VTPALKIGYRKLEGLAFQCYQNGMRLHDDSIALAKMRSFASAFALSVIAAEEFGKGFAIEEIIFQARVGEGFHKDDEKTLRALLSNHKLKQGWFVTSLIGWPFPKNVMKRCEQMQVEKNNSLYVGVRKGNHQIVRPFLVSRTKAISQIRMVNGALITFVQARLKWADFDHEICDQIFRRRRLLKKLTATAARLRIR